MFVGHSEGDIDVSMRNLAQDTKAETKDMARIYPRNTEEKGISAEKTNVQEPK